MPTIQIKHRYTGAVLFEHEVSDEQRASGLAMRVALEAACKVGASLAGAFLDGATLAGATLVGARPILQIGQIGSRSDYLLSFITDAGVMVRVGCFFGTRDEFAARVESEHGDNVHGREYRAALVLIDAHAALWTPAAESVAEVA